MQTTWVFTQRVTYVNTPTSRFITTIMTRVHQCPALNMIQCMGPPITPHVRLYSYSESIITLCFLINWLPWHL